MIMEKVTLYSWTFTGVFTGAEIFVDAGELKTLNNLLSDNSFCVLPITHFAITYTQILGLLRVIK